jgi:hypothetical protein
MCLSRLLDDSIERREYNDANVMIIETMLTLLREKDTLPFNKSDNHLEGVVPFEILRAAQK